MLTERMLLLTPLLWPAGKEAQKTSVDQKKPLCTIKLIPVSYSHHTVSSGGFVWLLEDTFNRLLTSFFYWIDPTAQSNVCL